MQLYEYPGNDLMRLSLKFEHLFNKAKFFTEEVNSNCGQVAVLTIAEMLTLIDRVDLRNMLTRELSRHLANLRRLESTPHVDHGKLGEVVDDLEGIVTRLHNHKGLFAREVFENYFIQTIRRQAGPPGSSCPYNMPELQAWVQQKSAVRQQQCQLWLSYFYELNQIIFFLLQIARENVAPKTVRAEKGIYMESIPNPGLCQIIRVWIPNQFLSFPKFSMSQQKINIRFLNGSANKKQEQLAQPIEFNLAICSL